LKNKINREYNKKQKIVIKRIEIKYGVKIKWNKSTNDEIEK
jgi:hypothetical protein